MHSASLRGNLKVSPRQTILSQWHTIVDTWIRFIKISQFIMNICTTSKHLIGMAKIFQSHPLNRHPTSVLPVLPSSFLSIIVSWFCLSSFNIYHTAPKPRLPRAIASPLKATRLPAAARPPAAATQGKIHSSLRLAWPGGAESYKWRMI